MVNSSRDRLLEDWAAAWSSPENEEKFLALFTEDCVYEDVAMGIVNHGKGELRNFYHLVFSAFPDCKVELHTHFVAGNHAAAEWLFSGTHKGDFPGLPASNKHTSVRVASVFELQGSQFRRCSDYWDMATILKQIGAMPSA
jgi:steroid delta-isomerase-like uncharacterized protein